MDYGKIFEKFLKIEEDCYGLYDTIQNYVDFVSYGTYRDFRYNALIQIDSAIATMDSSEFEILKILACLLTSYEKEGRSFKYDCKPSLEIRTYIEYYLYKNSIHGIVVKNNGFHSM